MTKINSKIFKYGNSQAISLNKAALEEAGLQVGDTLEYYVVDGNKIIFEKVKEKPFKDQIKDYYEKGGRYSEKEVFNKENVGRKIW